MINDEFVFCSEDSYPGGACRSFLTSKSSTVSFVSLLLAVDEDSDEYGGSRGFFSS